MEVSSLTIKPETASFITLADCKAQIVSERYFSDDLLTICVLTLKNGFKVTGESAATSPTHFEASIGEALSRQRAIEKIWPLLGYTALEKAYQSTIAQPG